MKNHVSRHDTYLETPSLYIIYFPYYNITVGLHVSTALQFNTDCEAILAAFIWPDVYVQSLRLLGLPGVLFLTGQSCFLAICLVKQDGQHS